MSGTREEDSGSETTTVEDATSLSSLEKLKRLDEGEELIIQHDIDILESIRKSESRPPGSPIQWKHVRLLLLGLLTIAAAAVVSLCMIFLTYLMVTHRLAPKRLIYSVPLPLDLEGHDLTSNISFRSLEQYYLDGQIRSANMIDGGSEGMTEALLKPGQRINVWLEMLVPSEYERMHPERKYAHVVSDIWSYGGHLLARRTKPIVLNGRKTSAMYAVPLQNAVLGPWRWLGLLETNHRVQVSLFSGFVERKYKPSAFISVAIKARYPPGPEVLDAKMHVSIQAGLLQRLLFYARPQSTLGNIAGLLAAVTAFGGITVIGVCFYAYFMTQVHPEEQNPQEDDHESLTSSAVTSTAIMQTPRELDEIDLKDFASPSPRKKTKEGDTFQSPQQSPGILDGHESSSPGTSSEMGAHIPPREWKASELRQRRT